MRRLTMCNSCKTPHMWKTPLMRIKHLEKTLSTCIFNVISLRLREGYTIKDITIKGENWNSVLLSFY